MPTLFGYTTVKAGDFMTVAQLSIIAEALGTTIEGLKGKAVEALNTSFGIETPKADAAGKAFVANTNALNEAIGKAHETFDPAISEATHDQQVAQAAMATLKEKLAMLGATTAVPEHA